MKGKGLCKKIDPVENFTKDRFNVIPFEKLLKAQRQIVSEDEEDQDSENSNDNPTKSDSNARIIKNKKSHNSILKKRTHKSRPIEISSKKPVSRFRQVVEIPSEKRRDPRFDNLSGKLNEDLFEKSYNFLDDYKKNEIKTIKEQIRRAKDPNTRDELQKLLTKMQSRINTEHIARQKKQLRREVKKKELELVSKGKKPFYLKKSAEKELELVEKFKNTDPKSVEKIIEKRRKKNATKEHRYVPFKRRKT
ncbi:3211_t:CDS:2 [Ambispora leptoticha]|uniref:rRNA biogenesis protein RRP36 n=1 Tax=Ambispora leptoticha TaxID=144679 RepID=A0A9N9FKZ0_9GLOM|nr:3211_t:CDS:2 [Ambispora leptoticha]